jgi:hypothetical protein
LDALNPPEFDPWTPVDTAGTPKQPASSGLEPETPLLTMEVATLPPARSSIFDPKKEDLRPLLRWLE